MSFIDEEIGRFYDHKVPVAWSIDEYEEWMRSYEKNRYKYPDWVTKDGQHIPIYRLEDSHLANLISFVQRKDPKNETRWADLLKHEQLYRTLLAKVKVLRSELAEMEMVSEMCL